MSEQTLRRKQRHYSKLTPVCCQGCTFFKILNDSGHYLCTKDDGPVRKSSWCREYEPAFGTTHFKGLRLRREQ